MRSYAQYCPIAKASEVLGDRWTLLIVREMLGGAKGFKRFSQADHPVPAKAVNNLQKPKAVPRRFISKYDVPIPQASPVWALDFSGSTSGGGGGGLLVV